MQAEGSFSVDAQQRARGRVDLVPSEPSGSLHLTAGLQLPRRGGGAAAAAPPAGDAAGDAGAEVEGPAAGVDAGNAAGGGVAVAEGRGLADGEDAGLGLAAQEIEAEAEAVAQEVEEGVEEEELDARLVIRDGGMALMSALIPGCEWTGGHADVDLRAHGELKSLSVEGAAKLSRGVLVTPFLRAPLTGLSADIRVRANGVICGMCDVCVCCVRLGSVWETLPQKPVPLLHSAARSLTARSWWRRVSRRGWDATASSPRAARFRCTPPPLLPPPPPLPHPPRLLRRQGRRQAMGWGAALRSCLMRTTLS